MPNFRIAHINHQSVDLIIVPLESSFGNRTEQEQHAAIQELQGHAIGANLHGTVVPVWDSGHGMAFIAPRNWHTFFQSINLQWVAANLNKQLYW